MKSSNFFILFAVLLGFQDLFAQPKSEIDVAAYFWPSLQNEERSKEKLWSEGIGEWEIINKSTPRFEGHYQPRQPLWGHELDDEPLVMEKQIDEATKYGVNVFIFDWYWYGGKPFFGRCFE